MHVVCGLSCYFDEARGIIQSFFSLSTRYEVVRMRLALFLVGALHTFIWCARVLHAFLRYNWSWYVALH